MTTDAEPLDPEPPEAAPAVGFGRPPRGRPFAPGVSGNPLGRPRRAAAGAGRGRAIPAEPTELEQALALPVISHMVDASGPVPLGRALVARLTDKALGQGDVQAARELLRLLGEADIMRAERELLAAEAADEAARAAEAAAEQARRDRARAQEAARSALELMAEEAASLADQERWDDEDRALCLLDAVEMDGDEWKRVKPWVAEAARAHDPALPRGGDRPLDLSDRFDALRRLDILGPGADEHTLSGWFLDAARARSPDLKLEKGDEALLQLIRKDEDAEPDWLARLAAVDPRAAEAVVARLASGGGDDEDEDDEPPRPVRPGLDYEAMGRVEDWMRRRERRRRLGW